MNLYLIFFLVENRYKFCAIAGHEGSHAHKSPYVLRFYELILMCQNNVFSLEYIFMCCSSGEERRGCERSEGRAGQRDPQCRGDDDCSSRQPAEEQTHYTDG